jgi:hypothetical protein
MAQVDSENSISVPIASGHATPKVSNRKGADRTILSDVRAIDGASEDAATIPAIHPSANRRNDSGRDVADISAIAPPAPTSRRGFLMNTIVSAASIAAATAVAVPPISAAASKLAPSEAIDAELIMLGEQFDVGVKDIIEARERLDSLSQPVLIAIEANATWPENQNEWEPGHAKQYLAALTEAQRDIGGQPLADADTALEEAYSRTDKLSKVIGTLPARTVEGMAVKARVTALACSHYWSESIKRIDWEDEQARLLVESAFQAAGIESVESYLGSITTPMCGPKRTPLDDALERHRKAYKLFNRLYDKLDTAKSAAAEKHGHRPIALIAWRNYSHIGGGEIERARKTFLENGEDASIIGQEYLDAKRRYRAVVKAGRDWDKRAGNRRRSTKAAPSFARRTKRSGASVADASALLDLIYANLKQFGGTPEPWEMAALRNATMYLNRMTTLGKATGALVGRRDWQA